MNKKRINILTHNETIDLLKELAAENQNSIGDELTFMVHLVAAMGEGYRKKERLPELYMSNYGKQEPYSRLSLVAEAARSQGWVDFEKDGVPGLNLVRQDSGESNEAK